MPDAVSQAFASSVPVDRWLSPLDDGGPCGPDLEYDSESLEIAAFAGKPESQFGPAEPPNWIRVGELAESLFGRTRDLRVAMWWGRSALNRDGFGALPSVLALFHGLLDRFWDDLHPMPDADETDALARLSVIGGLDKLDGLLGDIRNSKLSGDPRLNGLRVRDIEVASGRLNPRAGEPPMTTGQVAGIMAAAPDVAAVLRAQTDAALASLNLLAELMSQRFSTDLIVDLTKVKGMLTGVASVLPAATDGGQMTDADDAPTAPSPVRRVGGGVHSVDSRQDAVRAIELVCVYLERNEPTNPAQLLLRRAARVIDKNFLQLVDELAPDAVKDVARIMGVDPRSITEQN